MILRDYQKKAVTDGKAILKKYNLLYLMWAVRTGKTATALTIAKDFDSVLFITKKKAIGSVLSDAKALRYTDRLEVTNYESLHKLSALKWDIVIIDEAHRLGGYPKKPKSLIDIKKLKCNYHILLSGTPCPESWSQIYHQLAVSKYSPFNNYTTFYKWAKEFVTIKKKFIAHGMQVNDYSNANIETIKREIQNIVLTRTQKETGFKTVIKDKILTVEMKPITYQIANRLLKDEIVKGKSGIILADTAVKMQQKLHQIYSGSCKLEDNGTIIIDTSKADFIKQYFKGKKIAIFYKFIAELEILKSIFKDDITTDIHDKSKNIAGQFLSIREGVNLKHCDALVFYNIDFSNVSYLQARDRANGLNVLESEVYFVFSKRGIEEKIYKTVTIDKQKYNLTAFKKDYLL